MHSPNDNTRSPHFIARRGITAKFKRLHVLHWKVILVRNHLTLGINVTIPVDQYDCPAGLY